MPEAAPADVLEQSDPILARNLAKMQERPTSTDLEWRQPKERIRGSAKAETVIVSGDFPSPEAITEAVAYSRTHLGLGLLIWHDGQRVASDFAPQLDAGTPFASYSMHKTVLAIALLAAQEDGYIRSVDDPVGRYIPQWRGDPRGDITLRQFLNHSSGMQYFAFTSPQAMQINLSGDLRAAALRHPASDEPGTVFQYNNVNSLIAGIALQNALAERGLRYADYLAQKIWQPLGNADAAVWLDAPQGAARYHSGLEAGLGDWLNIGIMLAGGGVFDGKQVLSKASVDLLTTPSELNPAYGLHLWLGGAWSPRRSYGPGSQQSVIHSEPFAAPDVWFLDGFGGQRVYAIPSAKLAIARFGNVDFAYDDSKIVNTVLRGLQDSQ